MPREYSRCSPPSLTGRLTSIGVDQVTYLPPPPFFSIQAATQPAAELCIRSISLAPCSSPSFCLSPTIKPHCQTAPQGEQYPNLTKNRERCQTLQLQSSPNGITGSAGTVITTTPGLPVRPQAPQMLACDFRQACRLGGLRMNMARLSRIMPGSRGGKCHLQPWPEPNLSDWRTSTCL